MLVTAEEEEPRVQCIDDITDKALSLCLRTRIEVFARSWCEKADERDTIARSQVTPVDTWINTKMAFEGSPYKQISSRREAREFKSGDRPDVYAGTPPLEAFKAITCIL